MAEETLFTDIINNLGKAKKEGKLKGGYRFADDGKLKLGGGYYDDDKMFEIEVGKDNANVIFKKRFADGGSTNGSADKAFTGKVKELMEDGYEFGEAVKEAMRQGYAKGGPVSEALLKTIDNTQGVKYVPTTGELKVRNYSRGAKIKDKRFKLKDYKTPALALQAAKQYHYDTVLSKDARMKRISSAGTEAATQKNAYTKDLNKWTEDWVKKNITKTFSIADTDKALKAMSDDFKKSSLYKIKGPKKTILKSGNFTFPNIGTLASSSSPRLNALNINNLGPATNLTSKGASPSSFFKSVFLSEKLAKDPQLKNAATEYMKYATENKIRMSYAEREAKLKNLERNPSTQN